jgi:hypothetical protein
MIALRRSGKLTVACHQTKQRQGTTWPVMPWTDLLDHYNAREREQWNVASLLMNVINNTYKHVLNHA